MKPVWYFQYDGGGDGDILPLCKADHPPRCALDGGEKPHPVLPVHQLIRAQRQIHLLRLRKDAGEDTLLLHSKAFEGVDCHDAALEERMVEQRIV